MSASRRFIGVIFIYKKKFKIIKKIYLKIFEKQSVVALVCDLTLGLQPTNFFFFFGHNGG
jgi:hypothetical protein